MIINVIYIVYISVFKPKNDPVIWRYSNGPKLSKITC